MSATSSRNEYGDAVRADIAEGRALGVQGVPFVVFDRRFAASGAQSVAGYAQALDAAAEVPAGVCMTGTASSSPEQTPLPTPTLLLVGDARAAFCDPDSGGRCALPTPTSDND